MTAVVVMVLVAYALTATLALAHHLDTRQEDH